MEPLLEVRDLRTQFFTLNGVIRAVDGISFELSPGETLGLVGESGCGKSVTALSIMRILPEPAGRIVGGTIHFRGQNLASLPERKMEKIRGNKIAMVYQEPMTALNPAFTIGDQVGEVFRFHQELSKREALQKAVELLQQVGIPSPASRVRDYPHQLSGGMRQRAVIAMAIACNPEILIADEPVTALDVTIQAQILDLILNLRSRLGMSLILISHDLGVVANMVKRVIVMYAGRIVEAGGVEEIFRSPLHPYTRGLFQSIPRIGRRVETLPEIPGSVPNLLTLPSGCKFVNRCAEAMDRCSKEEPDLFPAGTGRYSRCWNQNK
ncbi:MAG: ABC transporter ATP-binding protein [Deltaproteobacteria bacterium]|nr:MAG: ABC transporter ATP-binding protein [Deltaproteobacteria bacterium]